jgi:hypothetical protein
MTDSPSSQVRRLGQRSGQRGDPSTPRN